MSINTRIFTKFPLSRNQKIPKLNTNLFCELFGKNRRKGEQTLHKIPQQKSNRRVKTIPKISMNQSHRIQSRKITDIFEKIVGPPVSKQNHKPGLHCFVAYDVTQVAVFYAFFLYLRG